MRGHRDLVWTSAAAVVGALIAALLPWGPVRVVAALPLTLFLPGYAIIAAAFGSRAIPLPQRLTLSVGTSLAVLTLSALLLNAFPFGLTTTSWAVLLPVVVIGACRAAALRREPPQRRQGPAVPTWRLSVGNAVLASAALLIAVGSLVLAQTRLPADKAVGFSALWMVPADAKEEAVVVGVISNEQNRAFYRLHVSMSRKGRAKTYRLALDPGEEKTFELAVPPTPGGRTHVVASLFRAHHPQRLYRRVTSWLPREKAFP